MRVCKKTASLLPVLFLISAISAPFAAAAPDMKSGRFIDFLSGLKKPSGPLVFEDSVVFTVSSNCKSAGISFAHENFEKIYRFKKLMVPIENPPPFEPESETRPENMKDSGILFYVHTPRDGTETGYRLIIDGLWERDLLNPVWKTGDNGVGISIAPLPDIKTRAEDEAAANSGILAVNYKTLPGETITLAGDFNGWDPFMYKLKEQSPGNYSIKLPLPPGLWHYTLFCRGERILDPGNPAKKYNANGLAANTIKTE